MEFNYTKLKLPALISLGDDTFKLIEKSGIANAGLTVKIAEAKFLHQLLEEGYAKEKASKLSKLLEETDGRRDSAINGIKAVVKSFDYHFDRTLASQADDLLRCINKYGDNIASLPYSIESTAINNLIDDFEKDPKLKTALSNLFLADWVAELKTANAAFIELYLQRNDEEADKKPKTSNKDVRKDFIGKYKELIKHLEAMQTVSPSEENGKILTQIETLFSKYERLFSNNGSKEGDNPTS